MKPFQRRDKAMFLWRKILLVFFVGMLFIFPQFALGLAPRSQVNDDPLMLQKLYEELSSSIPATPQEAVRKVQYYCGQAKQSDSPLLVPAKVSFFVTTPGYKGWFNDITSDAGLYGKVLPPLILKDGRSIIPIVGDIYEVEHVEINGRKPAMSTVTINQWTDTEIEQRFGLARIYDGNSAMTADFYTLKDVVGRLAFTFGPGGFVEAHTYGVASRVVDSPLGFLDALIYGDPLSFSSGRLDFKAFGTIAPKLRTLFEHGRSVTLGQDNVQLKLKHGDHVEDIALDAFLKRPGIVFGSTYQPGFPSPAGTEVSRQSLEVLKAERRLRDFGGDDPQHTFSRFSFTPDLAGTLRFTLPDSLRVVEALAEYQADPVRSRLGQWKANQQLEARLEAFFEGFGKNSHTLFATGKIWIIVGHALLHNITKSQIMGLDETYKFFKNNYDIIGGRPADLGDYISLADSRDEDDIYESTAIMLVLGIKLIRELEDMRIIERNDAQRLHLLTALANGFTHNFTLVRGKGKGLSKLLESVVQKDFNRIEKVGYAEIKLRELTHEYTTHERQGSSR